MEPTPSTPEQALLYELRRRRAELRESMSGLEHMLAAPASRDSQDWREGVDRALAELVSDFREHVEITEGPDGLYRELERTAPRLSGGVARLAAEHARISDQLSELASLVTASDADVDTVRDRSTALLGTLVRHRQRGSDLVFEAYEMDLGGET